jgi:TRAP-type C4-dicarboxylate transport system permease small subunit
VRADLFVAMFPPKLSRVVTVFGELLGLAFAILLAITGTAVTWQAYDFGDVSTTSLRFPLWIYSASLPVGALMMAVAYLMRCVRSFKNKP